jgi:hypothetical protein
MICLPGKASEGPVQNGIDRLISFGNLNNVGDGGWRDRLPKDGNYVLEVVPSGEPFTISVEVN